MRILVIKLSSIGDIVHTMPAVAALRKALPMAHISWVVDPRSGVILDGSPVVDELIQLPRRIWKKHSFGSQSFSEIRACLWRLRRGGAGPNSSPTPGREGSTALPAPGTVPEIAIDFQGLIKSGIVALASGAKRRIGFENKDLREPASRMFLTRQVPTAIHTHKIDKNLELARSVIGEAAPGKTESDGSSACNGRDPLDYEFPFFVSPGDEEYANQVVDGQPDFAIINPGGGWPTKLWDARRYGQIADWLWSERGLASLITYGPGEEPLAMAVKHATRSQRAKPVASTLKQYIALARRARLFVGGDTGPLHIAAACRTPVVGLYGPTSPERNGPFGDRDVTLGRDLWCRPDCHRRRCWH
ncbi:MAG TPA: glycosyltransferase family 9 protein, partial [Blastocatellia bacterium]|nr:glycosyltransferase family 9 protein [Blastocatellia bacterium]